MIGVSISSTAEYLQSWQKLDLRDRKPLCRKYLRLSASKRTVEFIHFDLKYRLNKTKVNMLFVKHLLSAGLGGAPDRELTAHLGPRLLAAKARII